MDVTYLDYVPLPGPFVELELHWHGVPLEAGRPLSFNQRNHLTAVAASGRSTWIGGTVDIGGADGVPLWSDEDLAAAVRSVVAGAPSLCSVASGSAHVPFPSDAVTVTVGETRPEPPAERALGERIAAACLPGAAPGIFAARAGTTLLFAVDHVHADMLSIDLVLRRLWDALHGRPVIESGADLLLPAVESDSGAALEVWGRFFRLTDGHVPAFPVQLCAGMADPVHDVRRLTRATGITGELDRRTFAVLLTSLAEALEPLTGSPEFATIVPVHTRGRQDDPRHHVVGWMVSNAPVVARAGDVASAAGWLRDAVTVAGLPLETMIQECRPVLPDGVVPMVSYMDFRHRGDPLPQARYISSTSPTDTAQLWFSRTRDGLAVRAKYPETPEARQIMGGVLDRLSAALR
ncbi:hypothetical protein [Corynebacterium glyciniphilum]|uniref:hypothetical protein n=1 Tax=Corynebacterium glyciniphilum TaxID=1404244 RepID=UPI003FD46131